LSCPLSWTDHATASSQKKAQKPCWPFADVLIKFGCLLIRTACGNHLGRPLITILTDPSPKTNFSIPNPLVSTHPWTGHYGWRRAAGCYSKGYRAAVSSNNGQSPDDGQRLFTVKQLFSVWRNGHYRSPIACLYTSTHIHAIPSPSRMICWSCLGHRAECVYEQHLHYHCHFCCSRLVTRAESYSRLEVA